MDTQHFRPNICWIDSQLGLELWKLQILSQNSLGAHMHAVSQYINVPFPFELHLMCKPLYMNGDAISTSFVFSLFDALHAILTAIWMETCCVTHVAQVESEAKSQQRESDGQDSPMV